ncbi:MAG: acyl-CoA dehydrogenase family protein, partial [Syntrophales bacterium]|nr:acyl-CoA dehydrogenase family protein [Syntrophales bacterium]
INYAGYHLFNEVFFDDVRVPATNLVGKENNGWSQLMHALGFERGSVAGRSCGYHLRIMNELIQYCKENLLFGRQEVRHKLADIAISIEIQRNLACETTWKMSKGINPVYEPSRDKVLNDQVAERLAISATEILGMHSQMDPLQRRSKWTKLKGYAETFYWLFPGVAIAAGTDEIELNIVGQFGLKLPKSY